jgi:glycosyltransferase involved in cell wall biosynthesis
MTKEKPLVSVIIPTFNGEAFIDRTIQSVLNQTVSDFEIIVINDGSTDNTKKLLSEWVKKDLRIKIIDTKGFGVR